MYHWYPEVSFVDHFLAPIVCTWKSYIQDTSDFLRKLGDLKDIPSEASLVTLDVCSLYTNIPNLEGLNAAYDALGSSRDESLKPSNLSLMELLNQVLTLNDIQWLELPTGGMRCNGNQGSPVVCKHIHEPV